MKLCYSFLFVFYFNYSYGIVPVVFGPSIKNYIELSPPHSFIHIDSFKNINELAKYLGYLDHNNTAYDEYFAWHLKGKLVETRELEAHYLCRMCSLSHAVLGSTRISRNFDFLNLKFKKDSSIHHRPKSYNQNLNYINTGFYPDILKWWRNPIHGSCKEYNFHPSFR